MPFNSSAPCTHTPIHTYSQFSIVNPPNGMFLGDVRKADVAYANSERTCKTPHVNPSSESNPAMLPTVPLCCPMLLLIAHEKDDRQSAAKDIKKSSTRIRKQHQTLWIVVLLVIQCIVHCCSSLFFPR